MSFLVPLYLAGALAVAIPIYLHLRRRPPRDRVEFSSLMFLQPTRHQPLKRRSQLENIPLLLLRCLSLLLLAAMFARPFLPGGETKGSSGRMRTVVLLDTSASMQREGVWADALEEAGTVISTIKPDGALAIIAVDRTPRVVTGFEDWENADPGNRRETAESALNTLEPGWQGSDLGSGLVAAAEMIADASADDETPRPARIVVLSDLQTGTALGAVADASWPSNLAAVELVTLEADLSTNIAITAVASNDPGRPSVRLRNDPASEESRFTIEAGGERIAAVVPAGESRVFQLEQPASEVTVTGDPHQFDNRLFLAPREPVPVRLLFLGDDRPDDSNGPE
ncbi:MAG: VWA domain-containing protein [Akkermansiaceae bacterium]|nr:VWA domain-containing protein [Akkermansiaceae bacterium]